ncbi:MAG: GNAT family protein [Candidatus Edwardsbacteria bacterium]
MQNPFLIGEKTYLRPVEIDDIDTLVKWTNDAKAGSFLWTSFPTNHLREKEFIEELYTDKTFLPFVIMVKNGDVQIGITALRKIDQINNQAELAISIGEKEYWEKGFGSEATQLMIDYAFNTLNLHRLYLYLDERAKHRLEAFEQLAFKKEGILRKAKYEEGEYHDIVIMGLLRTDKRTGLVGE